MRTPTNTQDLYTYWRKSLEGVEADYHPTLYPAKNGIVSPENPQPGFYRKMYHGKDKPRLKKDRPMEAVAIWMEQPANENGNLDGDEILRCTVNGKSVDAGYVWMWCCDKPITHEQYTQFMEEGKWFDGAPSELPKPDADENQPAANAGHNQPPEDDELIVDDLTTALDDARRWLKDHKSVDNDDDMDAAGDFKGEIAKLRLRAEKVHKKEKDPHLKAGRAVDEKYNPSIKKAKTAEKVLQDLITPYLDEKQRRAGEEARKAREAVEAARRVQEKTPKGKKPAETGYDAAQAPLDLMPEPEKPEPVIEPVKVSAGGNRGKAIKLRTYTVVKITDYDKVQAHYRDNPLLRETLEKWARQDLISGKDVPGAELKEERRAV